MNEQKYLIKKLQMVSDILQSDKIIESFSMFPDNIETTFLIIEELEINIPMLKGFSREQFNIDISLYDISNKAIDYIKYKYNCLIREEKINEII